MFELFGMKLTVGEGHCLVFAMANSIVAGVKKGFRLQVVGCLLFFFFLLNFLCEIEKIKRIKRSTIYLNFQSCINTNCDADP